MAQKFWAQVDFNKIPVRNLVVEGSPTPPLNPNTGQMWVDTTDPDDAMLNYWDGNEWINLGPPIPIEGPVGPAGPAGPPGASSSVYEYNLSTSNNPPPGSAKIATNATGGQASTLLYIDYSPVGTTGSYAPLLRAITANDQLTVTDKLDASKFVEWIATGNAIDHPAQTYVEVPILYQDGTAIGKNGQNVFLFHQMVGVPGPKGDPGTPGVPGNANVTFSSTAPAAPKVGDIWWKP